MTKLADVAEMTFGFAFKSAEFSDAPGDIRLLRGDNIAQGRLRWDGAKRFPSARVDEVKKYELDRGDVVIAMDRPWIGAGLKYSVVRDSDIPSLLVQRVTRLRAKDDRLDQGFLAAIIGSQAFTDYVIGVQTGSAVPHISGGQIGAFKFDLPGIDEQRAIASTLGVLDEKLDSNRKSIDLARDLMRALYRRALTGDFVKASSVLTPILGGTPSRAQPLFWGGDIPWASAKDIAASSTGYVVAAAEKITPEGVASSAAKVLPSGSIVMTARGTVGALARIAKPMAFNQSCYGLVPKLGVDVTLLFLALEDALQRIRDAGHGTVFNTVNMATFDQIDLALPRSPSPEVLAQLDALSSLVLARVHESNRLVATRDALLPELLSGRLRVPEAAEVLA